MENIIREARIMGKYVKKRISKRISDAARLADAIKDEIDTDIRAVRERDPAATSDILVLLTSSGVHAILSHRASHALHEKGYVLPARLLSQMTRQVTGIEIHPGAKIGRGFVIDHGTGVVIGETTEIGDNCTLYQGVTLGGTGKDQGKRHPTLGNNVMVGAGAKVLGPLVIGDNSKIASNAVVLSSIPADSTAVGIPAKVVRRNGVKVDPLDQIHIPDPVAQEIRRLEDKIDFLEFELEQQKDREKVMVQNQADAEARILENKNAIEGLSSSDKADVYSPAAEELPDTTADTVSDMQENERKKRKKRSAKNKSSEG